MKSGTDPFDDNPMDHPPEQPVGADGIPHFSRLFAVLGSAVGFIGLLAVTMEAIYT